MAEAPSDPMPTYSQVPSAAVDSAGGGHILVHGGGSVFNSYGSSEADDEELAVNDGDTQHENASAQRLIPADTHVLEERKEAPGYVSICEGPKQCLICTSDFGAVLLSALLVLVAIFSVIMLYRNTMLSGSTLCTEYEALTTETILCGMGDSCSASGMNVSVGGQYTTNQAIKTWLVPRDKLKSYNRQREPVRFEGPLTSSILFSSPTVTYYSWRETVVSGNCCIINNGGTTAQVTLEIFPTYHSAIKPIQKDAIFRENISVKSNNTQCFDKWGPGKPFVAEIDGYFFFSLSTSTEVNYIFEMVTKQVYVNGMQYRDPHYFTSSNYSALAYGKCFENSGVHKQPEDYIILCKAISEDVETESLEILSCPLHLSSPYKNLWLSLMAVFSILALIFIVIAACIFWRGKLWKIRKQPQQECTTDSSELLV